MNPFSILTQYPPFESQIAILGVPAAIVAWLRLTRFIIDEMDKPQFQRQLIYFRTLMHSAFHSPLQKEPSARAKRIGRFMGMSCAYLISIIACIFAGAIVTLLALANPDMPTLKYLTIVAYISGVGVYARIMWVMGDNERHKLHTQKQTRQIFKI